MTQRKTLTWISSNGKHRADVRVKKTPFGWIFRSPNTGRLSVVDELTNGEIGGWNARPLTLADIDSVVELSS